MEYTNNPNIQEVTWKQVRMSAHQANPELATIIDAWDPPKDYTLLKVSYQYGDILLQDGLLYLPDNKGNVFPITSSFVPNKIKEQLSYSNFPLGLITAGGNEVFLETNDRVISLIFFNPVVILGLWESLDPNTPYFPKRLWNVCAGTRSLFMLPKISEASGHNRLKKLYEIKSHAPKKLRIKSKDFQNTSALLPSDPGTTSHVHNIDKPKEN